MAEAEGLPDGPAKVALVERAVAIADSHQDLNWRSRSARPYSAPASAPTRAS